MSNPTPLRARRRWPLGLRALRRPSVPHLAGHDPLSGTAWVHSEDIDALNGAHWDALCGHQTFLSRDYLRVLQQHAPDNLRPHFVMVLQAGRPKALMLLQGIRLGGDRLRMPDSKLGRRLRRWEEHWLVAGNLLVWGPRSLAFAPDVPKAQAWAWVQEAVTRVRRALKHQGPMDFVMIKDWGGHDDAARTTLQSHGFRHVETEPDMALPLNPAWRTMDDYLGAMTSGYRSAARKLLKDCAQAGATWRMLDAGEMQARAAELHALYEAVHHAQGMRWITLQPGYLPAMAQALGPERFRCRVIEQEGRLLGFVTSVRDAHVTVGYYIGYDRQANATAPLYLSLLQSTVEDALHWRSEQLSLGRTALEPKAKMGAEPLPLSCSIQHRLPPLNWVVGALARGAGHEEPPERHPFKRTAG